MSGSAFRRFFDDFGKVPEPRPPIIPKRYRIAFFLSLSIVALLALLLLIRLAVIPGIERQQSSMPAGQSVERTAE